MSLRCTVRCSSCDTTIPLRNDLPHGGRFRACCSGCGAAIIFGASSLRWCYEPAPQATPMVPAPRSLPRRRTHPRWTGSHAITAPVKKARSVSAS
jgi:hypothetical protein